MTVDPIAFKRAQEVAKRKSVARKSCAAFIDLCVKIRGLGLAFRRNAL
jgi:hypothetical protein